MITRVESRSCSQPDCVRTGGGALIPRFLYSISLILTPNHTKNHHMNIYTQTVYCDVCGEPGMATPRTAKSTWYKDSFISHSDPRVCADNLKRKKRKEEQEKTNPK